MERTMSTPYRDRSGGASAYRAVLMFRTIVIVMAAILIIVTIYPQIDAVTFSVVCLIVMLPALIYQIRLDNTLIHTGSVFVDDGANLYVVVRIFNLGYGRTHHMNKKVKSYRISCVRNVKKIRIYPFGISIRAEVVTASSKKLDLNEKDFNTPGTVLSQLEQHGHRKTVLFRVERGLQAQDEKALLGRLEALKNQA